MRKTLVVLSMILLVFIVPAKCLSLEWLIDEVDRFTMSGGNLSMAFDKSTNTPHISYLFNDAANGIRYATLNDGVWLIELVTNSQGRGNVPIALNEIANPVIFYGSDLDKTWYLATRDGAWSSEIVQSGASIVGWRASLAINPNGDVHAAYFNYRYYYHTHAWKSATGWNIDHDAPGHASFSAMKFDSIGVLHKAYNGYEQGNIYDSKIYYAKLIDGSWVTTPVYLQSTTILCAMDLDSNIYPHILFSDRADESHTILKYIFYDGNQWRLDRSPEIDVGANWGIGSLAVDSQDRVHIAFTIRETVSNVSGNKLMYGFLDNSGWHMEEIQPELISQNPNPIVSIATDNQDHPVVAYYDAIDNALKYAKSIPVLVCTGFELPMDNPSVTVHGKNRALPLKAQLVDSGGNLITNMDIIAPPVIQVIFTPSSGEEPVDVSDEALSAGQGTDGNQFEFTYDDKWQFNLKTKNYSALGTYVIKMVSGNDSEYKIEPSCETSFVVTD